MAPRASSFRRLRFREVHLLGPPPKRGRRKDLEDRLNALIAGGPGFRQRLKDEAEKLYYDLSSALDDFVIGLDSRSHPDKRPHRKA